MVSLDAYGIEIGDDGLIWECGLLEYGRWAVLMTPCC